MSIYNLSDAELQLAFDRCMEVLGELLHSQTYSQLAKDIGIGESALKQFVRRGNEKSGRQQLRRGAAFDRIYQYVVTPIVAANYNWSGKRSSPSATGIGTRAERDLDNQQKLDIYGLLMRMLGIRAGAIESAAFKIFDRRKFYCFRNAITERYVVVSEITFNNLAEQDDRPVWEFNHYYQDTDFTDKKTDGVALVMHGNIYLLGDIQRGEGLDIFLIREPLSTPKFLLGFLMSIDDEHRPFFANAVLVDSAEIERENEPPFFDANGVIPKHRLQELKIPGNDHFGVQLSAQLDIDQSNTVLRFRKRHFLPPDETGRFDPPPGSD